MTLEKFVNDTASTLSGSINALQTTLQVASAAGFPTSGNFRIVVDSGTLLELMLVTGVSGTTFTVTRGIENTTATSHASGVAVTMVLTAGGLAQTITDNIEAIDGDIVPGTAVGIAVPFYVRSINGAADAGGAVDVGATVTLTANTGSGGLSLGAWTGDATMPTGRLTWQGASGKTATLISNAAAMTLTAGASSTWSTSVGDLYVDAASTLHLGNSVATTIDVGSQSNTSAIHENLTSGGSRTLNFGSTLTSTETSAGVDRHNTSIANAKTVTYDQLYDNGNSGSSKTIAWTNAQKQKLTLTANCTATLTAPSGPCNLMLKVIQDGSGGHTLTLSGVKWPGGTSPTFTSNAAAVDLVGLFYDGSTFYGTYAQAFS